MSNPFLAPGAIDISDYTPQRGEGGGGPNSSGFNWDLYNSLLRDPNMGGSTGWSPDFSSLIGNSLDPTGVQLDQNAI